MQPPSITESPNELTTDIDVASPEGIVRLLRAADAQIYNGYRDHAGVCDGETVEVIGRLVEWTASLIGRADSSIVISGAGTSGRLAMFVARTFNDHLRRHGRHANFHHLIAGGDLALIKAQEGAEDDPHQACADLQPVIQGKRRVLYFGITCAFAAPYVAGQLWHLSGRRSAKCVLVGFNPIDRARDSEIENWDKTFADVVRSIGPRRNCEILNPIVGPEPVTGSTRMKSGSATKLLLETIFALAVRPPKGSLEDAVRRSLLAYEQTRAAVYEHADCIAGLLALGGRALRRHRHIYYVGAGTPGILGIVDASECPPTYGADFEDVRGFIGGGWKTLLGPGRDLSRHGPWYRISLDGFVREKLPHLKRDDLVVGLPGGPRDRSTLDILRRARRAGAAVALIDAAGSPPFRGRLDACVRVNGLPRSLLPGVPFFEEYATKLILNALTTGAHIMSGKVYGNRMVDLRISNTKLYYRTLGIIQHIMGVSADVARRCLLRSIYGIDRLTPQLTAAKPSRHVEAATQATRIVPRALVMAGMHAGYAAADRIIRREPVVRAAIERLKQGGI